jgi:hypothetical protein
MVIAKASVLVSWLVALGLATLLMQVGAPVGVAATSAVLLIGLTLFLAGRAVTNMDPDGTTGSLMIVPGTVSLLVTAVACVLLGKEYWPQANALLLFGAGLAAVVALCAIGNVVVDRLVPQRRTSEVLDASSSPEAQNMMWEFFGDPPNE